MRDRRFRQFWIGRVYLRLCGFGFLVVGLYLEGEMGERRESVRRVVECLVF